MKCMVTGAVGFIGLTLCGRLIERGFGVIGIDSFVDYYPRILKREI